MITTDHHGAARRVRSGTWTAPSSRSSRCSLSSSAERAPRYAVRRRDHRRRSPCHVRPPGASTSPADPSVVSATGGRLTSVTVTPALTGTLIHRRALDQRHAGLTAPSTRSRPSASRARPPRRPLEQSLPHRGSQQTLRSRASAHRRPDPVGVRHADLDHLRRAGHRPRRVEAASRSPRRCRPRAPSAGCPTSSSTGAPRTTGAPDPGHRRRPALRRSQRRRPLRRRNTTFYLRRRARPARRRAT